MIMAYHAKEVIRGSLKNYRFLKPQKPDVSPSYTPKIKAFKDCDMTSVSLPARCYVLLRIGTLLEQHRNQLILGY